MMSVIRLRRFGDQAQENQVSSQHRRSPLAALGRIPVRRTVRLRLTLLYGGMFCACGAALLAITYLLVSHFSGGVLQVSHLAPAQSVRSASGPAARLPALPSLAELQRQAQHDLVTQHSHDLHQLLVWSLVALALTGVLSLAIGWLAAGRVLAPLRTMTARTRRISQDNLHERLALGGPADELRELGDTIDELLARLETAFGAQQRFVANASHELRTPLTRIRTALDVAIGKPGPAPPQLIALDQKIREGLDRADRLMESLLALGRAEHGELTDSVMLPLHHLIDVTLDEHEAQIASRQITVQRSLDTISVIGSPALLGRLVENVIDNGIRHNQTGGWMRAALRNVGGRARLTVDTSGPPLEQALVDDLAQPFRRLRTDRTGSVQGAGLGLSIVAAIAAAHRGTLALHAREQGGLRVVIDLPVAPPHCGNLTGGEETDPAPAIPARPIR
jgi:signal transduction histidine kinase